MNTVLSSRVCGLLALLAPALVTAQSSSPPPLTWVGTDLVDGRPSSVRFTAADAAAPALIAFGAGRACRLEARFVTHDGNQFHYDVTAGNGGWCDRFQPGRVVLRVDGRKATLQVRTQGAPLQVAMWPVGDATRAPPPRGTWTGLSNPADPDASLASLQLADHDPGDTRSRLVFGSPDSCRLSLRYEGATPAGAWYAPLPGNGGARCDRLLDQWVVVREAGDAATVHVEPTPGDCADGCRWTRSSR
ncbi:hypothetical protein [Stenotrophomonas sp. NPDC077461]|jgi:hypothetical protein|uniref:hypothetical protein n=1 Tax=Stenotrophomonas TaxID=40323 RepID=UPI003C2FE63E